MVVAGPHVVGLAFFQTEDHAPLIIHAYAVKPLESPAECPEPVARRGTNVAKQSCGADHVEPSQCHRPDIARGRPRPTSSDSAMEIRGCSAAE